MHFQTLKSLTQTRILFSPFSETSDIHPTTKKVGIRAHSLPVAALLKILSIFGLVSGIVFIQTGQGLIGLNAGSFRKWCSRHNVKDANLTALEKIKRVLRSTFPQQSMTLSSDNSSSASASAEKTHQVERSDQTVRELARHHQLPLGKDSLDRWSLHFTLSPLKNPIDDMKELVSASLRHGFDGRIHNLEVGKSSIDVMLCLGFEFYDYSTSYAAFMYGTSGLAALEERQKLLTAFQNGDLPNPTLVRSLGRMIKTEKKTEVVISAETLIEYEPFFKELAERQISNIRDKYLPDFLEDLENNNRRTPESQRMHLSQEGIARWKEAIESGQAFKSFDSLEQLRALMSNDQRTRLTAILAKRDAQQQA